MVVVVVEITTSLLILEVLADLVVVEVLLHQHHHKHLRVELEILHQHHLHKEILVGLVSIIIQDLLVEVVEVELLAQGNLVLVLVKLVLAELDLLLP